MKTKQFKYIIVTNGDTEKPVLFDPCIVHSMVHIEKTKVVSAGFCKLILDERFENGLYVEASGESISLKLKSREIDKDIIYKTLIPGPWDYGLQPGDPLYNEIDVDIKKKVMNETI